MGHLLSPTSFYSFHPGGYYFSCLLRLRVKRRVAGGACYNVRRMNISSRTPEGMPNHCPICNADVCIEPSVLFGDATCPNCGHLLWFLHLQSTTYIIERPRSP